MSLSAQSGADSAPLNSLLPVGARGQSLCAPSVAGWEQFGGQEILSVPGASAGALCAPKGSVWVSQLCPKLSALCSALCLKSCEEESSRGAALRWFLSPLPPEAALLSLQSPQW